MQREDLMPDLSALGDQRECKTRCHVCHRRRMRLRQEPYVITWYCRACQVEGSVRVSRRNRLMEEAFTAPLRGAS